jgi:NCS1 family nucleobase:cation symporter-1
MDPVWLRLFQCAWFIGFLGGGVIYYLICLISPPPGGKPYARELFGNEHGEPSIIDGVDSSGTVTPKDVEKSTFVPETK